MLKTIFYWIATALVCLAYAFGGYVDVFQQQEALPHMERLGYPAYFFTILGVWKLLAVVAVAAPKLPRLKEWAYAGIFFNLTGAAATHGFMHDPIGNVLTPLIVLAIVMTSWALRPPARKLPGSWL